MEGLVCCLMNTGQQCLIPALSYRKYIYTLLHIVAEEFSGFTGLFGNAKCLILSQHSISLPGATLFKLHNCEDNYRQQTHCLVRIWGERVKLGDFVYFLSLTQGLMCLDELWMSPLGAKNVFIVDTCNIRDRAGKWLEEGSLTFKLL